MGRPIENRLHFRQIATGWQLYGRILGKRVRERFANLAELMARKTELEAPLAEMSATLARTPHDVRTWLRSDRIDAYEAFEEWCKDRAAHPDDVIALGKRAYIPSQRKKLEEALEEWAADLKARHRRSRTVEKNVDRIRSFMGKAENTYLADISPSQVEKYVLKPGLAPLTQLTNGRVLATFFSWCVKRRYLGSSPMEVDLKDLAGIARPVAKPAILTTDECAALWAATQKECPKMIPYLILSLWCFMRSAEVRRTTLDKIHADEGYIEVLPVKSGTVSHRTVAIPQNMLAYLRHQAPIYWSKRHWAVIRKKAGLAEKWQENILRHTGISYLYQKLSEDAKRGAFGERSVIAEVCRQAGNSEDTAFRHYVFLPRPGAYINFYSIGVST